MDRHKASHSNLHALTICGDHPEKSPVEKQIVSALLAAGNDSKELNININTKSNNLHSFNVIQVLVSATGQRNPEMADKSDLGILFVD